MKRITATLLLALCCCGCFSSDKSLYKGIKPLQPLHSGPVTSRDKNGKLISMTLAREANGNYRLTGAGKESGKGYLLRLFSLEGAPSDMLVVEVKNCENGFKRCGSNSVVIYELARLMPGKVEWRDPDCSKTFSKLSGIMVEIDSCKFSDRAALEKALRAAAAMPWKADGSYLLH
jgi:hypothetical protein